MADYREVHNPPGTITGYIRASDGVQVPWPAPGNADADEVREWLDEGGVADPPFPPPVHRLAAEDLEVYIRTTDGSPQEVVRYTTTAQRIYRVTLQWMAVDIGNGATKDIEVRYTFKRPAGTVSQVGSRTVIYTKADTAAAAWDDQGAIQGSDLVLSVTGAAGRTLDWIVSSHIVVYGPGGI